MSALCQQFHAELWHLIRLQVTSYIRLQICWQICFASGARGSCRWCHSWAGRRRSTLQASTSCDFRRRQVQKRWNWKVIFGTWSNSTAGVLASFLGLGLSKLYHAQTCHFPHVTRCVGKTCKNQCHVCKTLEDAWKVLYKMYLINSDHAFHACSESWSGQNRVSSNVLRSLEELQNSTLSTPHSVAHSCRKAAKSQSRRSQAPRNSRIAVCRCLDEFLFDKTWILKRFE